MKNILETPKQMNITPEKAGSETNCQIKYTEMEILKAALSVSTIRILILGSVSGGFWLRDLFSFFTLYNTAHIVIRLFITIAAIAIQLSSVMFIYLKFVRPAIQIIKFKAK